MTNQPIPKCPGCNAARASSQYLCPGCWVTLQKPARTALSRGDDQAARRLGELLDQINSGVPLHKIVIAP